jgi:hypothetical protein
MKISELISQLESFNAPDMEVMIIDSFNGGGHPREINLRPIQRCVVETDAYATDDCEDKIGSTVVILGYGNY